MKTEQPKTFQHTLFSVILMGIFIGIGIFSLLIGILGLYFGTLDTPHMLHVIASLLLAYILLSQ